MGEREFLTATPPERNPLPREGERARVRGRPQDDALRPRSLLPLLLLLLHHLVDRLPRLLAEDARTADSRATVRRRTHPGESTSRVNPAADLGIVGVSPIPVFAGLVILVRVGCVGIRKGVLVLV